jgi:hypothetical protein
MGTEQKRHTAVKNMLFACAGARPGDRLLILREDPAHGYYGRGLATEIATTAEDLGLAVNVVDVPVYAEIGALPAELEPAFREADHALFLARLGDQIRFLEAPGGARAIVSYVLDVDTLTSEFATAPYQAFVKLKHAFDGLFRNAARIRVTCASGTDFSGRLPPGAGHRKMDVTVKRFPMSVFAPLDAGGFSGRVAVDHFLVGTGSRYYDPYAIPLDESVFAEIDGGRICGWRGPEAATARVRAHYAFVGSRFDVDADVVHSWHAGIHPACAYKGSAAAHFERWSGSAFGNPRLLHFHTCGAYAPGEICWNVVDPTIEIDGRAVWREGRIEIDAVPGAQSILDAYPGVQSLFETPVRDIGINRARTSTS